MFKFLKDKLKSWTEKVASAPQEEQEVLPIEEEKAPQEIEQEKIEEKQEPSPKKEVSKSKDKIKDKDSVEKPSQIPKPKKDSEKKEVKENLESQNIESQDEKIIEEEIKILTQSLEEPKIIEESQIELEEIDHIPQESIEKKESFLGKFFKKKKEIVVQESIKQIEEEKEIVSKENIDTIQESPKQETSLLQKVKQKVTFSKLTISKETFDNYAVDLQELLLENNVAYDVSEKIIEDLSNSLVGKEISRKDINEEISHALKEIVREILIEPFDLLEKIKSKKEQDSSSPFIIMFCGINGSGKTTSIAKLTNYLKENKYSCVLAAGDTFRAASIEQLKIHGEKLDVKVIAQEYGHDPAAVAYDAVSFAKKHAIDIVLIDTAGRMHTEKNLMHEIEKISRVVKPDVKIFVGESITGNDATEQAKAFNYHVGIDGIILSKSDIDEKGGTALSVGYITKKPILFLGVGQNYSDIEKFDKEKFIQRLGL